MHKLIDFLTPIETGLTPVDGGGLSPARAAELHRQLRELDQARHRAAADSRSYVVGGDLRA